MPFWRTVSAGEDAAQDGSLVMRTPVMTGFDATARVVKVLTPVLVLDTELEQELADVRAQLRVIGQYEADQGEDEEVPPPPAIDTVKSAFELAVGEAPDSVMYLDTAFDSIEKFGQYHSPQRLYEALTAVSEAAEGWRSGSLSTGFKLYFESRGYEFSSDNPHADSRRYRAHYRRQYDGETVVMKPHLKVDQATAPDQCLRIYWYRDDAAKTLVIGHVGRHLPPS